MKWETKIEYSRYIDIEDADLAEFDGNPREYLAEYTDYVLEDLEDDYEGTGLTSSVQEREVIEVDADELQGDDDE